MKSNRYYDDHDDLHTHIGMLEARLIILENSMSPPSMTLPTHAAYSGSGTNGVYYVTATETVFTKLFQSHTGLMTNDALRVISQVSNSGTAVSEFKLVMDGEETFVYSLASNLSGQLTWNWKHGVVPVNSTYQLEFYGRIASGVGSLTMQVPTTITIAADSYYATTSGNPVLS